MGRRISLSERDKLLKEYNDKLEKLQDECPHPKKSKWKEFWWAIGHSSGYEVKVCLRCGKILDRRGGIQENI